MLDGLPMAFGPGVPLHGLFGVQVVYPFWLVGVWLGLLIATVVISHIVSRLLFEVAYYTGFDPFGVIPDDEPAGDFIDEPRFTVEELEARLETTRRRWRDEARSAVNLVVVAPVVEESIFRGVPLLIALTATGPETLGWLLLGGTVVWAVVHKRRAPRSWLAIIGIFAGGLVLVYLWLNGLWWVAVLVHAGHNLVLLSIGFLLRWWDERGRPFRPGDEYTVTISPPDELSMTGGLFGAYTPDRERLYVPDLQPGETARVRVATTIGRVGFGVPIDRQPGGID